MSGPAAHGAVEHGTAAAPGAAGELARFSALGCALTSAVLLVCGFSPAGAVGAGAGLAAVAAAGILLIRRSERVAAGGASGHRGRRHRHGSGTHRG
ncbi:hypothetical protein ACF1DW_04925 [Streptomyces sp. NPDC014603]|uniref:hypothetical protein n=1 Tax=Streptomyces sp. NPDC014603 TaxID=3364873 RepID=UPI0037006865